MKSSSRSILHPPGSECRRSASTGEFSNATFEDYSDGANSYTYNGFGPRLLKAFPGGAGEIYQYGQNGMVLEETDQAGTPQADYIYLHGRPIATVNPATGALRSSSQAEISRFHWFGGSKFETHAFGADDIEVPFHT